VLRSCTNLYSYAFDLLGDTTDPDAVYAFAKELASSSADLDGIQLDGLDPQSGYFSPLLAGIRDGGAVAKSYRGWSLWYESTVGVTFEQYLAARPAVLRNTWLRKSKSLARRSGVVFRINSDCDVQSKIEIYDRVRRRSWKSDEPFADFIPQLVSLAHRLGALRFGTLLIDSTPTAAQFWIVWKGQATIYKLVYDTRYAPASPGTLLTMEMIRSLLQNGDVSELNFGRGNDPYKELWVRQRREKWGIEAANPRTLSGLRWSAAIRAALLRDRLLGHRRKVIRT
jgi:hypothetical protein